MGGCTTTSEQDALKLVGDTPTSVAGVYVCEFVLELTVTNWQRGWVDFWDFVLGCASCCCFRTLTGLGRVGHGLKFGVGKV